MIKWVGKKVLLKELSMMYGQPVYGTVTGQKEGNGFYNRTNLEVKDEIENKCRVENSTDVILVGTKRETIFLKKLQTRKTYNEVKDKMIFTAYPKELMYRRADISKFVLGKYNAIPINPFLLFDYNLMDLGQERQIREANNKLVEYAEELWVFGDYTKADGVLREIGIAKKLGKKIRYFVEKGRVKEPIYYDILWEEQEEK